MRNRSAGTLGLMAVFVAVTGLGITPVQAEPYRVDPAHAYFGVKVWHFGVAHMRAEFTEVAGEIDYDSEDPAKTTANLTIKTNSLASSFSGRVDAVKGGAFLDVANHPEITFVSKSMKKKGDGYEATGDLTIKGVTKEVTFPLVINGPRSDPFGNMRMGIEGSLTIDRQDYGLSFDRKMNDGTPIVGDEVQISFSVEATSPSE